MISPEQKRGFTGVSLAIALGLGLTACADQSNTKSETSPTPAVTSEQLDQTESGFQDFTITHIYTKSGKRFTAYGDITDSNRRGLLTENVGYCDGGYLVEMPVQYYGDGGNSVVTRTKFDGCDDGKLTSSDFPGEQK